MHLAREHLPGPHSGPSLRTRCFQMLPLASLVGSEHHLLQSGWRWWGRGLSFPVAAPSLSPLSYMCVRGRETHTHGPALAVVSKKRPQGYLLGS